MTQLNDLIVMFPCYVPMRPGGGDPHPYTATTDHGEVAVPICTDHDVLVEMFSEGGGNERLVRAVMETPRGLVNFLALWRGRQWKNGPLTHVLIDPKHGATSFQCHEITEFCTHILKSPQ